MRTGPTLGSDRAMARKKNKKESAKPKTPKEMLRASFGVEDKLVLGTALFLIVDALHLIFFDELNGYFREILSTPGERSIVYILVLYFVYSLSLGFLSRLKSGGPVTSGQGFQENEWPKIIHFYPSFGFGIIVILALVEAAGWSSGGEVSVSEGWEKTAILGGMAIYLLQLCLGTFDLIEPRYDSGQVRYYLYLIPCAVLAELMLNFSFALWLNSFGAGPDTPPLENPSQTLSFLVMAPLFYVFFAAPRFIFMRLNYTWLTMVSGLALTFYELWRFVGEHPVL